MSPDATETAELVLQRLRLAVRLLDEASEGITAIPLAPVRSNVSCLGEAIASVSEVLSVLYQAHPSLAPKWLETPNPHSEASRALGALLIETENLQEEGRADEAVRILRAFLESSPPELHKDLAEGHLELILSETHEDEDEDDDPNSDTSPS